jgi:hypothetical protein
LKSDATCNMLVLSFTEMGLWGALNSETEKIFKIGTQAIMDAIEEHGQLPFHY